MSVHSDWGGWHGGRVGGERWRGCIPIPPKAHPLVRRLIEECNAQQTTLTELAKRAGMSRLTISGWRYNSQPMLPNLVACFNALGLDLVVVKRRDDA